MGSAGSPSEIAAPAAGQPPRAAPEPSPKPKRPGRAKSRHDHRRAAGQRLLHLDLDERDVLLIDEQAHAFGMSRVAWIRALIAYRLRGESRFSRQDELSLLALHAEARAMRTELAMVRRRLEGAGADAPDLLCMLTRLEAGLVRQRAAIRASFEGNLDYWRGDP